MGHGAGTTVYNSSSGAGRKPGQMLGVGAGPTGVEGGAVQGLVGKQTPEVQSGGMLGPWALAWNLSLILQGSWMGLRAGTDALYCLGWRGVQARGTGGGRRSWSRVVG